MRGRKKKIIVPTSGGKDSLLTLLMAIEKYSAQNIISIFNDTGWEHPETYSYLQRLENTLGINIIRTNGGELHGVTCKTMEDIIIEAGFFPHRMSRFCSHHLKIKPALNWYKENCTPKIDYEVWLGVRLDESSNRKIKYGKYTFDILYDYEDVFPGALPKKYREFIKLRLPILELTTDQVFHEIRKRGVEINPLYFERTADRVGCYPCLIATRNKQAKMFNTEFGKIQLAKIRELEKKIGKKYEMIDSEDTPCGFCLI